VASFALAFGFVFIDHALTLSYNQWQADYPLVAPAKPLLYVQFSVQRSAGSTYAVLKQRAEEGAGNLPFFVRCRP